MKKSANKLKALKELLAREGIAGAGLLGAGIGGTALAAGPALGAGAGGLIGLLDPDTYGGRIGDAGKEMVVDEDTGEERGPIDNFYDSIGAHMLGGATGTMTSVPSALLGALLAKKLPGGARRAMLGPAMLGGALGGYGGYRGGYEFGRDYETKPNPDDPRNKSASTMEKSANRLSALLGKLGVTNTDGLLRRGTKAVSDSLITGPAALLGGGLGLGVGAINAPEGKAMSHGLGTGAGIMAAILGGRGGRYWLQHLASKKGLNLNMGGNIQRLLGYGGIGSAAGMGTAAGVKGVSESIGL